MTSHFLFGPTENFLVLCSFLFKILILEKQYVSQNHTDFITFLTKNSQVIFAHHYLIIYVMIQDRKKKGRMKYHHEKFDNVKTKSIIVCISAKFFYSPSMGDINIMCFKLEI